MLERYELDAFLTLARELHFGRTAERLHVSPTRVSQIIRKLERRVGVPLFHRSSRHVELTTVGRTLQADLEPAWTQIATGFQRAVEAGRGMTGILRAGFVGAAAGQLVLQIAEVFQAGHPGCEVRIREAQRGEALPLVRDDAVDVLLTAYPIGDLDLVPGGVLISEARLLAVPARLPEADAARLPVLKPSAACTFQEVLTMVGAGQGTFPVGAHVRRYYPRPDVAYVLSPDPAPVEWGLVWHRDRATARVLAFNQAALDR
jgi:DNA-binding transcriptional LysR family regulator